MSLHFIYMQACEWCWRLMLWLKYHLFIPLPVVCRSEPLKNYYCESTFMSLKNSVAGSTNSSTETKTRTEEEPNVKLPPSCPERRRSSPQLCIVPHISITWHAGPRTTPEQTPSSCTCSCFTVDALRLWCIGRGFFFFFWSEAVPVCMICNIKQALQSCTLVFCQAFFWYGKVITGERKL